MGCPRNESYFKMDPEGPEEEQKGVLPEGAICLHQFQRRGGVGPREVPQQATECVSRLVVYLVCCRFPAIV